MRVGYVCTARQISTSSGEWKGPVVDYLSRDAFLYYWDNVLGPILDAAGKHVGTTLKSLETDSWECGGMNWTPGFEKEFKKLCGYDIVPYLPVLAGEIVESRDVSNRFLADFRKVVAHCIAFNHYATFAEKAHSRGMLIQPESGGPHTGPLDAITNLGRSDIVMGEFWVQCGHRSTPRARFYCKQASSVAHTYGKKLVGAESFTSIGPQWSDRLWFSQKPAMDHEFCSGLNMLFLHTFTCSPPSMGLPGQEYFAGTHMNSQVTWWDYSGAFFKYINRCMFMFQQGDFVADVLHYYGDHVPNIAGHKEADPAGALPGFDYDLCSEEIFLKLKVEDGRVIVPGGVAYRLVSLPEHQVLSLAALEKVKELLREGASVTGLKPLRLVSLIGGAAAQKRFKEISDELWGADPAETGMRKIGRGRLFWGKTAREVLLSENIKPDFEILSGQEGMDYIHYTIGSRHVYFISNQQNRDENVVCRFRIAGRQPELWNQLTGEIRPLTDFKIEDGRTEIPLQFLPFGSCFVVFDKPIAAQKGTGKPNFASLEPVQEVTGPWRVRFDPKWGEFKSVEGRKPGEFIFEKLVDWTTHKDNAVKHYSGKCAYSATFECASLEKGARYVLDLGDVRDIGIGKVTLNGKACGLFWSKPFRVDITDQLRVGQNELEVEMANSWYNRLVLDAGLPEGQRLTRTNIKVNKDSRLIGSGLLGPVQIYVEK